MRIVDILGPVGDAAVGYQNQRFNDLLLKRKIQNEDEDRARGAEEYKSSLEERRQRIELQRRALMEKFNEKNPEFERKRRQAIIDANSWLPKEEILSIQLTGDVTKGFGAKPVAPRTPPRGTSPEGLPYQVITDPTTGKEKIEFIPTPKGFKTRPQVVADSVSAKDKTLAKDRWDRVKDEAGMPMTMKELYRDTGKVLVKNVPPAVYANIQSTDIALAEASRIMKDVNSLADNMSSPNGLASRFTDWGSNKLYRHGFNPGGAYGRLASLLSMFSVTALTSGAMNQRLTVPVITLLTPHLPNLGMDTMDQIRNKMNMAIAKLNDRKAMNKVMVSQFYGQDIPVTPLDINFGDEAPVDPNTFLESQK